LIQPTGGSGANRTRYTNPACLCIATYAPTFLGSSAVLMGEFVYKIEYEFSGMKAPGLSVTKEATGLLHAQMPQPPVREAPGLSVTKEATGLLHAQMPQPPVRELP